LHGREKVKIGAVFVKCVVFNTSCVANFPSATVAMARAERDVAQAVLLLNGQESINNLPRDLSEARAALAPAEASLAHEQQQGAQLQVDLD